MQSVKNDFRLLVECQYKSRIYFLAEFNDMFNNILSDSTLKKHLNNPKTICPRFDKLYYVFFDIVKHPKINQYFSWQDQLNKKITIFDLNLN